MSRKWSWSYETLQATQQKQLKNNDNDVYLSNFAPTCTFLIKVFNCDVTVNELTRWAVLSMLAGRPKNEESSVSGSLSITSK